MSALYDPAVRPEHVVVDCASRSEVRVPMTDEEWAAHRAQAAARVEQEAADIAAREQEARETMELAKAVAAHPDPVVQALAARLGIAAEPTGGVSDASR